MFSISLHVFQRLHARVDHALSRRRSGQATELNVATAGESRGRGERFTTIFVVDLVPRGSITTPVRELYR